MAHHAKTKHQRLIPLGGAIDELLKKHGWKDRIDRERVLVLWERLVGEVNAAHAKACRLEGNVLIVQTDSPVWSHTLRMMTTDLLRRLREAVPTVVIRDIRFVCGEDSAPNSLAARSRRYRRAPRTPL